MGRGVDLWENDEIMICLGIYDSFMGCHFAGL